MTLQERLHAAEVRSVQVYQRRTDIAQQQMQMQQQAQLCDLEMAKIDGEIACLRQQLAEAAP